MIIITKLRIIAASILCVNNVYATPINPLQRDHHRIGYETIAQFYTKPMTTQLASTVTTDHEKKLHAFQLFAKLHPQASEKPNKDTLTTIQNIHLFRLHAKDGANGQSLFARIHQGNTTLTCGETRLAHIFANPISDSTVLRKRQDIVRLLADGDAYEKLSSYIKNMQPHEATILNFLSTIFAKPATNSDTKPYTVGSYDEIWLTGKSLITLTGGVALSILPIVMQVSAIYKQLPIIKVLQAEILAPFIRQAVATSTLRRASSEPLLSRALTTRPSQPVPINFIPRPSLQKFCTALITMPFKKNSTGDQGIKEAKIMALGTAHYTVFMSGLQTLFYCWQLPGNLKILIKHIHEEKQRQLIACAQAVKAYDQILALATTNSHINRIITALQHKKPEPTVQFTQLLDLLRTHTFTGDPSILSRQGRIEIAHNLLQNTRTEFGPLIAFLAELDAHIAIAKLHKQHASQSNGFNFPEYIDQPQATIDLKGFWNPMIASTTAVPNSLMFSTDPSQQAASAAIVTGSNTAGKSVTAVMGPLLTVWCAQTLTIAPAAAGSRITPFHTFKTFMKITDDVTQQKKPDSASHYGAEADLTADFIVDNESRSPHEKVFIAGDEIYESTTDKSGNNALYDLMQRIITHPNTIAIIATQFQGKATELEKDTKGTVINLHVDVKLDPAGKRVIERSREIKRGVSKVDAAPAILEEFITQKRKERELPTRQSSV